MPRMLSSSDLRAALDAVGALSETGATGGCFARHGVTCIPRLVASDLTTLSVCDLATGHRSVVSDGAAAISPCDMAAFDRHFHVHPLVRAHGRKVAARTRRISDLVGGADFRRTPL